MKGTGRQNQRSALSEGFALWHEFAVATAKTVPEKHEVSGYDFSRAISTKKVAGLSARREARLDETLRRYCDAFTTAFAQAAGVSFSVGCRSGQ